MSFVKISVVGDGPRFINTGIIHSWWTSDSHPDTHDHEQGKGKTVLLLRDYAMQDNGQVLETLVHYHLYDTPDNLFQAIRRAEGKSNA